MIDFAFYCPYNIERALAACLGDIDPKTELAMMVAPAMPKRFRQQQKIPIKTFDEVQELLTQPFFGNAGMKNRVVVLVQPLELRHKKLLDRCSPNLPPCRFLIACDRPIEPFLRSFVIMRRMPALDSTLLTKSHASALAKLKADKIPAFASRCNRNSIPFREIALSLIEISRNKGNTASSVAYHESLYQNSSKYIECMIAMLVDNLVPPKLRPRCDLGNSNIAECTLD